MKIRKQSFIRRWGTLVILMLLAFWALSEFSVYVEKTKYQREQKLANEMFASLEKQIEQDTDTLEAASEEDSVAAVSTDTLEEETSQIEENLNLPPNKKTTEENRSDEKHS